MMLYLYFANKQTEFPGLTREGHDRAWSVKAVAESPDSAARLLLQMNPEFDLLTDVMVSGEAYSSPVFDVAWAALEKVALDVVFDRIQSR